MIFILRNGKLHRLDGLSGDNLYLEELNFPQTSDFDPEDLTEWEGTDTCTAVSAESFLDDLVQILTHGYEEPEAFLDLLLTLTTIWKKSQEVDNVTA